MSTKALLVSAVKGGTGKTKITAGLGKAIARQGKKVAFLDLDFFAPNLDVELDVTEGLEGDGNGHIIPGHTPQGAQFVSFGQVYDPKQATEVDEESAIYEIEQLLKPGVIAWEDADYMVIDTAPTSSGVIQACLLVPDLVGTIIVSQPSRVSRADLLRSISLMRDKRVPVLGAVVNQSFYICPSCRHQSPAYDLSPEDIATVVNQCGIPILGNIPHTGNLDIYFDELALRVLAASPVILPEEKRASGGTRKILGFIGNIAKILPTQNKTKEN